MYKYFIKIPWWIKKIFPSYVWNIPTDKKVVYLTFDDGPHPTITPWVLDNLKKYNAKASFFCIGDNVQRYATIYQQIISHGHAVGNHTQHHLNGWKTTTDDYIKDVESAAQYITTKLFRPPYGRIKLKQANKLPLAMQAKDVRIIMWDVLSADFDKNCTQEQFVTNVMKGIERGSIVVFHDSEKAFFNLKYALPIVLQTVYKNGYVCEALP